MSDDRIQAKGLGWLGMRTKHFEETTAFFQRALGLELTAKEPAFAAMRFPNGDVLEVFGESLPGHDHFDTGPVVGFAVGDIDAARAQLEREGAQFFGPTAGNATMRWAHFRAPDGNVYELSFREA